MSGARLLIGDVFERMAELPDGSVDLVLTSPPFLALRSYLPADHPLKAKEIGSEPTPAAFVDTLLALTAEWRRVLAPHGSIAVELGDTYSGSGGAGGDYAEGGLRDGQDRFNGAAAVARAHAVKERTRNPGPGWPLAKSLCLIPELYRVGLVYGINPLTGQPSPAGQFRARNVVRWCRPNPPVGALGDKFRPATSEMVIACVSGARYFDLDAVRVPYDERSLKNAGYPTSYRSDVGGGYDETERTVIPNPAGAPPLDWWEIPTHGYPGSHYATWPPALCEKPVKAMVPSRVCLTCGEPSRRIAETTNAVGVATGRRSWRAGTDGIGAGHVGDITASVSTTPTAERVTLGWTDCGHDAWRNGIVLDPFAGSGTTLAVATGHGRDAIGIDLDARNADLCRDRVGMFLTVEQPEAVA